MVGTIQKWLIEPSQAIQNNEKRNQARLISAFLILLIIATGWMASSSGVHEVRRMVTGVANVFLIMVYGLSRTKYYQWAGVLTVLTIAIPPFANALLGVEAPDALKWLIMSILAGGLWMSVPGLVTILLLDLAGILILINVIPDLTLLTLVETLIFLILTSSLIVVATTIRQRHERALIDTNQQLQKEVIEHKQTTIALRRSEERFRLLIQTAGSVIVGLTPKFMIFEFNKEAERIYGMKRDQVLEKNYLDLFIPEKIRASIRQDMEKVLSGTPIVGAENSISNNGGYESILSWNVTRMLDGDGNPSGVIGIGQDITARKQDEKKRFQLEEQLRQSQKMEALGTLAGGIAHEFNNLLAIISSNAEIGMDEFTEDSPEMQYLSSISEAVARGADLVRQILTFSRLDTARFNSIKLSSVVQSALKMVKITLPANIELHQELMEPCPNIMADTSQIYQVVLNLCTNASHAMEETGGLLTVLLVESDKGFPELNQEHWIKLCVKDTGKGISKEDQEKMFDPFFTTKEVGKGTGLGLSVVHGIVQKHQGYIIVDSEIGKGTAISIYFPKTNLESKRVIQYERSLGRGEGRILIVEDEPSLTHQYKKFLEKKGYVVTTCHQGSEALDLFTKFADQFDLVLTDQAMPKMTGKQLAQQLLALRPDIPIILSTGYSGVVSPEEAHALGIQKYLMKPFELKTLHLAIEECLMAAS